MISVRIAFRMSSASPTGAQPVRRRRRRRAEPKGWKAIPKPVKILMGLCLAVLILLPLAWQNGWIRRSPVSIAPDAPAAQSPLVISEATRDRVTRTIQGVVKNNSANAYGEVQVSYYVRDAYGVEAGMVMASIPAIGPNDSKSFQTDPIPQNGSEFVLREVVGTPR